MDGYISPEVLEGLRAAQLRSEKRKSRLRVQSSDQEFRVLTSWENGFSLEETDHPHLRGVVDLYEGPRHVSHCLIIHSRTENGRILYEYKRATVPSDGPAADFVHETVTPLALLT
jgi:hypothetical protein